MEVAARFDKTDLGDQGIRIDERFEWNKADVELATDGDHDPVELLFDQCTVRTNADL